MVFKRKGSARFYFAARTVTGWSQLPTGTTSRACARKVAAMWERLALEERAWDLLNPVLAGELKITRLYDLWQESDQSVSELRRRLADPDLEPYVAQWKAMYQRQRPKNVEKAHTRLRWLLPAGESRLRSTVTTAWLTERLYAYTGKPGTLRGVHSAWSGFFGYLADVHGLFEANPMARVRRPSPAMPRVRFLELDQVHRVVDWQPSAERRAFFAIAYGTGIESGIILNLTRADLHPADHEIRAAGTKTHTRDRMAKVSEWAWPILWACSRGAFPTARLFPEEWRADLVSLWHRQTLKALGLPHLPLHNARHHWAVSHLRAGVPIEGVRRQLGHSTPILTLKTYGPFIPTGDDRSRWESLVSADTQRRKEAT